jgi:hypothetical protein
MTCLDIPITAESSPVAVCGETRSGLGLATEVKRVSMKQEPTHGMFVHA